MCLNQGSVRNPVGVHRIVNLRTGSHSDRDELPITRIKSRINEGLGDIVVLTVLSSCYFNPSYFLGVAVYYFKIETIPDARLPFRVQVSLILLLDLAGSIEEYHAFSCRFQQQFDCSSSTLQPN